MSRAFVSLAGAAIFLIATGVAHAQMMGTDPGGYGMMGAYPWQGEQQATFSEAMRLLDQSAAAIRVDKAKERGYLPRESNLSGHGSGPARFS